MAAGKGLAAAASLQGVCDTQTGSVSQKMGEVGIGDLLGCVDRESRYWTAAPGGLHIGCPHGFCLLHHDQLFPDSLLRGNPFSGSRVGAMWGAGRRGCVSLCTALRLACHLLASAGRVPILP